MQRGGNKARANLIDRYTMGARVAPVAVAAFPLFLAVSSWIPFQEWPVKLAGGSTLLVLAAFVLAQVARDAGKAIEGPLWSSWGGPPTVRMLRHRDSTFAAGTKARIHARLVELGIVPAMPSAEDETGDPAGADATYQTCSDWLRNKALEWKQTSPFDVVHSENISYGYRRNVLGIRKYALAILAAAVVANLVAFLFERQPIIESVGLICIAVYLSLAVTPAALKRAADEYSIRLLNAVDAIPSSKPAPAGRGKKREAGSNP